MEFSNPSQKPDVVVFLTVMTLVSGILNLLWSAGIFIAVIFIGMGTLFIGCICLPVAGYPLILGILEIMYALRLLRSPVSSQVKPAYHIAVMEIIDTLFGNVIALVVGILALIFYNQPSVRRYFGET